MRLLLLGTGFVSGAEMAAVTDFARNSGLTVGSYSFAGGGDLIIPGLLVPYAMFWGWTVGLRRNARPRDLALFAAGIHFGVGLLASNVAGFLLAGVIFADGSALATAVGLWWARHVETRTVLVWMAVAVVFAFV